MVGGRKGGREEGRKREREVEKGRETETTKDIDDLLSPFSVYNLYMKYIIYVHVCMCICKVHCMYVNFIVLFFLVVQLLNLLVTNA